MQDLLPYYERELSFLRRYAREFAERYPRIAGNLLIAGDVCEDPHIERMIQSYALMNSRISKRLDDDYPQFTEALFEVMYPHYLRPFPCCTIVQLLPANTVDQLTKATVLSRGMALKSFPVKGAICEFRTAYDVALGPLALTRAQFAPIASAPAGVQLPPEVTSTISITLSITGSQTSFVNLGLPSLRVFIDGEASFSAALRDVLFMRTVCAFAELPESGRWVALPVVPLKEAGFSEEDALIPFPARSHPAYRLLTEYFSFPEKFNFFDIDLEGFLALLPAGACSVTLHLGLSHLRPDSSTAQQLAALSAKNLLLGCSPAVNLFKIKGDPIRLTHEAAYYPVLPDGRNTAAYAVYSIDSVVMVRETPHGNQFTEFQPFYSLHHGSAANQGGHYYAVRRDELAALRSPGYETEIAIVDIDFDPMKAESQTLSMDLTCSNRDLPTLLAYGAPGGDLTYGDSNSSLHRISMLRKPSRPGHFEAGRGGHWRLISQLSLNYLSLTRDGAPAFREILALYDLTRSPITQRQIGAIDSIDSRVATAWLPGNPFATLVRGMEIQLTVDEDGFVGSGLHAFASVINHFLGLYVHLNNFSQLTVCSKRTGEVLLKCQPRNGDLNLL